METARCRNKFKPQHKHMQKEAIKNIFNSVALHSLSIKTIFQDSMMSFFTVTFSPGSPAYPGIPGEPLSP